MPPKRKSRKQGKGKPKKQKIKQEPTIIPVRSINRDFCEHTFKEYELGELLGRGGSGTVYELCDEKERCPYALKVEEFHHLSQYSRERFIREIENQQKARAFAPKIYDAWLCTQAIDKEGYGIIKTYGFIVMDRMDGTLEDGQGPSQSKLIETLQSYIKRLHKIGISHGDIRAPNIGYKGNKWYLIDFSHSRPYDPNDYLKFIQNEQGEWVKQSKVTDEDQLMRL